MFPNRKACFVSAILWCAAAFAAQPVLNSSFDNPGEWTAVRGKAATDRQMPRDGRSSLRVESDGASDVAVESAPVKLTIGKRYELSGWIRTDALAVRERDRTPVAIGAALTMSSMPFDVHSESVGGTRDWSRVRLRFTATRADDRVLLTAGSGGAARGRAWFNGVTLEELSASSDSPAAASVETYGPGYRYPVGGWTYLHIQGQPYERGYQHGRLMAHEIPDYVNRCAIEIDSKAKERAWDEARTTVNALFLRGFDREILEEMKGIAEGAKDAGAKWRDRPIDLLDIVTANAFVDFQTLHGAMGVTPTGLEGLRLEAPSYAAKTAAADHCSAFAATGKATRDGKMVIGHITMWGLLPAEASNVMIDVQPATGHRLMIQSYAGGIASGLDWYQNDAGVVLTETTIRQSPFNVRGTPVAYRSRKAAQYGDSVEKVVEYLKQDNNGLYTNEWLIGDAKTNEIAMLELGTSKTKLWRSSRDEWFGGTEGFYWGCNNAKDLEIRLEYQPDPKGAPAHIPFAAANRDIKWQEMYREHRGRIDEQFGFLAFRTAPLVSSSSMDAKVTTADMASRMMTWAVFGKPNEREWAPDSWSRERGAVGIYSGGYRMLQAPAAAPAGKPIAAAPAKPEPKKNPFKDKLWAGWILPASDADTWLSAGSAQYYNVLREDDWEKELARERAAYSVRRTWGDAALRSLTTPTDSDEWYSLASHKGALVFDALRREVGDDKFFALMKDFFAANTTKRVSSDAFIAAAEKAAGKSLAGFFRSWLDGTGDAAGAPVYMAAMLQRRLSSTLIVYGTVLEAGSNRYAAERLRNRFLDWFESEVPVRKDFEVTDEELKGHDLVFVGRPETNSALAAWKDRLGLKYDGAVFEAKAGTHGGGSEALVLAAAHPLDSKRLAIVIAGNSALETVRVSESMPFNRAEYAVWVEGRDTESGFLQ